MTKLSLISLTCAAALAMSPAMAMSQCTPGVTTCYTFDFTSPTISISNGVLAVSDLVDPSASTAAYNGYDIVGFSGNYSGPNGVSGLITVDTANGWGSATSEIGAVPGWIYDNIFYPGANAPGTNHAYFDVGGVFFYVSATSPPSPSDTAYDANIWAGNISGEPGSPYVYTVEQGIVGGTNDLGYDTGLSISGIPLPPPTRDNSSNGPIAAITVPESGALSMLVCCAFILAGAFLFKARRSGLYNA